MIGKLTKGKGYRAAAEYLMNGSKNAAPDRGELVDTNLTGSTPREWAKEIAAYRRLRPSLGKAVFHASLSPADGDRELSDADWQAIGKTYLDAMGFDGCPFVAVIHRDTGRPHLHLLAVRIKPDGTVVSDAKDYQRSEKIIRQIERDWRLTAVESPRSHKKKEQSMSQEKPDLATTRQIVFESRLAEASAEAEAMLTGQPRPVTPTLECSDDVSDKQKREYKRDILSEDYRKAIEALLGEQVRLIRATGQTLSIHTNDGGRIQDNGSKVVAYAMSDEAAAVALIEMAMLKGMESIVLRGSDAFLRRAMAIAAAKGLNICPLDEHQLKIWLSVQNGGGVPPVAQATAADPMPANPVPATPQKYQPIPPNPLDLMTGPGMVGRRLAARREDGDSGTPPATLRPLSPRKPR
jgi:hypothetical protein